MKLFFPYLLLIAILSAATSLTAQVPNNYVTQEEDLPCLNKRFSLRVHINEGPDGPVPFDTVAFIKGVEKANEFFAPICISFEACEFLSIENYRYASHENEDAAELINTYGDPNRIDVYIPVMDSIPFICGRATFEGIRMNENAYVMVVNYCVDESGSTLIHELGHYFGLKHTFETEDGDELVNGDNCETAGDGICDTPADPYVEGSGIQYTSPTNPCLFTWQGTDANGQFYVPHVGNAMSYYDSQCACGFTHDQLRLMAENCATSPSRVW